MNFRSIGLSIATATVVASGATIASSPAQALSFNKGTFVAGGQTSITDLNTSSNPTSFTLNFQNFGVTNTGGSLAGGNLTGTPILASLSFTKDAGGNFATNGLTSFVTGLKYQGQDAFLDINPFTFTASASSFVNSATSYLLASNTSFTGVFRTSTLQSLTTITLGAVKVGTLNSSTLTAEIPTPALIPGLLGLGVAALRKRKAQANEEASAEA
ncbi:MAG: PTPA-CTERM sorting domain-containing protein [Stenomitos rutilans HA7619-LM2]|jgi:hypothetical protein|nr:PTPA-CTERM sorting domain-containing protein [Stenomitos rutilans HA7619-LM2]